MIHAEIKRLGVIGLLLLSEPRQTEHVALMKSSNSGFTKYCHPHLKGVQICATGSSRVRAVLSRITLG